MTSDAGTSSDARTISATACTTNRSGVSASGSHGRHLISTLTIIPAHTSSASASVGISGWAAQHRELVLDDEAEALDDRVVVHDEPAVGGPPRVELHAVGAELASVGESGQSVLGPRTRCAPVAQYERAIDHHCAAYEVSEPKHVPVRGAKLLLKPLAAVTFCPLACTRLGVRVCDAVCDRAHKRVAGAIAMRPIKGEEKWR